MKLLFNRAEEIAGSVDAMAGRSRLHWSIMLMKIQGMGDGGVLDVDGDV